MTIKSLLLHLYGERRDQAGQASGAGGVGDAVCLSGGGEVVGDDRHLIRVQPVVLGVK